MYLAVVTSAVVGCLGESSAPAATTAAASGAHLGHAVVLVGSGSGDGIIGPWPLEVAATVARVSVRPSV